MTGGKTELVPGKNVTGGKTGHAPGEKCDWG